MSNDEKAAAAEWKEYHAAIKKHGLDDIKHDAWHQEGHIGYMYDGFFAGFYAGRNYQRDKPSNKAASAAHRVLHQKGRSKAAKTKRGSALTQR